MTDYKTPEGRAELRALCGDREDNLFEYEEYEEIRTTVPQLLDLVDEMYDVLSERALTLEEWQDQAHTESSRLADALNKLAEANAKIAELLQINARLEDTIGAYQRRESVTQAKCSELEDTYADTYTELARYKKALELCGKFWHKGGAHGDVATCSGVCLENTVKYWLDWADKELKEGD